jgi:hypothetical protein
VAKEKAYLIVNSKVKAFVNAAELRVSPDFLVALNKAVGKIVIKACVHAKEAERATLRPGDVPES